MRLSGVRRVVASVLVAVGAGVLDNLAELA